MGKKSILLVEDDVAVRDMTKRALQREQYDVTEASTCAQAVRLLRTQIDLALIDYVLPDCNGLELLKVLREAIPSLPAILMTAYSNEDLAIKALRLGMTDYIKKPLDLRYLMKRLSHLLGGEEDSRQDRTAESREEFILDGIAAYIEDHYIDTITLNGLAGMSGMNKFKFCRAFKSRFRQSYTSFLNSIRIKNAVHLLNASSLSITEIAYFVGYNNVTHFERIFRTIHGKSPREYRSRDKQQA